MSVLKFVVTREDGSLVGVYRVSSMFANALIDSIAHYAGPQYTPRQEERLTQKREENDGSSTGSDTERSGGAGSAGGDSARITVKQQAKRT